MINFNINFEEVGEAFNVGFSETSENSINTEFEAKLLIGLKGDKGDAGADGQDGRDGLNGVNGIDGRDGTNGRDGRDGTNGRDGIDVRHTWNGTTLIITSANGTSSADLKGAKGDRGATGAAGRDGTNGRDGVDGYTPIKGVDYFDGADGKDGTNGKDGKDGKDGEDYVITEADYNAIAQRVPLPEIPTKVSELENDAEFISGKVLYSKTVLNRWNERGQASGSQSNTYTGWFWGRVRPIDALKPFRVKIRYAGYMPNWTIENLNAQGLSPASYGNGGEVNGYGYHEAIVDSTWFARENAGLTRYIVDATQYNTSYRSLYYQNVAYPKTQAQADNYYYFGISIYGGYQYYSTASNDTFNKLKAIFGRNITMDVLELENARFEWLDNEIQYLSTNLPAHTLAQYSLATQGRTQTGDINQIDRHVIPIYYKTSGALTAYDLCMQTPDAKMAHFHTNTANSTAQTKVLNGLRFNLARGIYYYASSTVRADGYALAGASFYDSYTSLDLRYSTNCGANTLPNVAGIDVYMRGEIDADGYFKPVALDTPTYNASAVYKSFLTTDLPTSADGYVYIYLGTTVSTNRYSITLPPKHAVYQHDGTRVKYLYSV